MPVFLVIQPLQCLLHHPLQWHQYENHIPESGTKFELMFKMPLNSANGIHFGESATVPLLRGGGPNEIQQKSILSCDEVES